MRNREHLYDAGLRAVQPLAGLLAGLHPKGRTAMRGRAASADAFDAWGRQHRHAHRLLVLLHAPSVGEALMAQAITTRLRVLLPDAQIAFSFFSPSAERIAARVGADISGYLPFDTRPAMQRLVHALRPDAVAFVRTEIWPILGIEAAARGAKVALVNAVLGEGSSRLRGPARFLLGPAYRRLDAIGAVAQEDAHRFNAFDVDPSRVVVTGDARFDQVWQRIAMIDRESPLLKCVRDARPLLVAGSTWPADDTVLLDALSSLPAERRPRVVIAPHEPSDAHLAALDAQLDARAFRHARLREVEASGAPDDDVIVVDRVGVLADLYAAATLAYVGGGFGRDGLHSVVEPAALGVPVVYGPAHGNAGEASDLAAAGGGFVIREAAGLAHRIDTLVTDATARRLAGTAAMTFVQSRLGGAERNAALIARLIVRAS